MTDDPCASARIAPLDAEPGSELDALLRRMTPPAAPNVLALFRVLARHPALAERMMAVGGFLLGRQATLSLRDREIVICRVSARCRAGYEWGVHVAAFSQAAAFTPDQVLALAGPETDAEAFDERDRLLLRLADALHDGAQVPDPLWAEVARHWSVPQQVELLVLAGWYHAIAYVCNGARVPPEAWAARLP